MNSVLPKLQNLARIDEIKNIDSLQIERKYKILKFIPKETRYGTAIIVKVNADGNDVDEATRVFLPRRIAENLTEDDVHELNERISKKKFIYLIYKGMIGNTFNVEFH